MLAIRLPEDIEARLAALASQTGRTKTFYARAAILAHLEDLEDYYLAAQTATQVREGREKTYSSKDVRAGIGVPMSV